MTANVIAESNTTATSATIDDQIEQAWGEWRLERNPVFRQIVEELSNPMLQNLRKAATRGYPRYAFAA